MMPRINFLVQENTKTNEICLVGEYRHHIIPIVMFPDRDIFYEFAEIVRLAAERMQMEELQKQIEREEESLRLDKMWGDNN